MIPTACPMYFLEFNALSMPRLQVTSLDTENQKKKKKLISATEPMRKCHQQFLSIPYKMFTVGISLKLGGPQRLKSLLCLFAKLVWN